jgi:hypothetical protein
MKKMSDVQKSNRGRKKPVTDSLRNRHKKDNSAKYNKTRVCIGDEYDIWTELNDVLRIKKEEILQNKFKEIFFH